MPPWTSPFAMTSQNWVFPRGSDGIHISPLNFEGKEVERAEDMLGFTRLCVRALWMSSPKSMCLITISYQFSSFKANRNGSKFLVGKSFLLGLPGLTQVIPPFIFISHFNYSDIIFSHVYLMNKVHLYRSFCGYSNDISWPPTLQSNAFCFRSTSDCNIS